MQDGVCSGGIWAFFVRFKHESIPSVLLLWSAVQVKGRILSFFFDIKHSLLTLLSFSVFFGPVRCFFPSAYSFINLKRLGFCIPKSVFSVCYRHYR